MKIILFFSALLWTLLGFSNENQKKHEISICAVFKNEATYLREWIEYHRMIGIDHFYLYNNTSDDASSFVLLPYIKNGLVTLVNWPTLIPDYLCENLSHFALSTLLPAYENAAKYKAYSETTWLCFLDVDEFIVPMNCENIREIMAEADEYGAIELSVTKGFRVNQSSEPFTRRFVTESCIRVEEKTPLETQVTKMIFRPECHTGFHWPPYQCGFKEGTKIKKEVSGKLQVNKYFQKMKGKLNFNQSKRRLMCDPARLSETELTSWLMMGYEIEDKEHRILQFVPELKKRIEQPQKKSSPYVN